MSRRRWVVNVSKATSRGESPQTVHSHDVGLEPCQQVFTIQPRASDGAKLSNPVSIVERIDLAARVAKSNKNMALPGVANWIQTCQACHSKPKSHSAQPLPPRNRTKIRVNGNSRDPSCNEQLHDWYKARRHSSLATVPLRTARLPRQKFDFCVVRCTLLDPQAKWLGTHAPAITALNKRRYLTSRLRSQKP